MRISNSKGVNDFKVCKKIAHFVSLKIHDFLSQMLCKENGTSGILEEEESSEKPILISN